MVFIGKGSGQEGVEKPLEAPKDIRSPQERFTDACRSVFIPVPVNFGYRPIRERAYGNRIRLAKEAVGEMARAGFPKDELVKMLLAYPLELRWDILEHDLLPAWNAVVPQQQISLEELKRAKGVVEEVRTDVATEVRKHTGGHR